MSKIELILGKDYYIDDLGRWVFTKQYHLERGFCCSPKKKPGCLNCPYREKEAVKNLEKD